jgi:hypothetical protein
MVDDIEFGRRKTDGLCLLHIAHEKCFEVLKEDIKDLERIKDDFEKRISAMEPVVGYDHESIEGIRKMMLTTLVSVLCTLATLVGGIAFIVIKYFIGG